MTYSQNMLKRLDMMTRTQMRMGGMHRVVSTTFSVSTRLVLTPDQI
jgi:hypothetical protein